MAKLLFLLDGNVIKEYALDKERMTIGRRASNDIHIDNLAISGEHAEIITAAEEAFIQDLNSTNGTFVNKKQIKKQTLSHGDTIGLGKYQLKYLRDLSVMKAQNDGFADTVMVEVKASAKKNDAMSEKETPVIPETQTTTVAEVESAMEPSQSGPEQVDAAPLQDSVSENQTNPSLLPEPEKQGPRLQMLNGDNVGNALLLDKSMVKLGTPGVQVAVVTKRQDGYFLTHVAGNQYPLINGKSIGAQAHALSNHDEIEVLEVKMEFFLD
jgi:pSer/pThr/pTyr-binding forkhead associated (FHA) protein